MSNTQSVDSLQARSPRFEGHRNKLFARDRLDILFYNLLQNQSSSTKNAIPMRIQDAAEFQKCLYSVVTSKAKDTIFVLLQDYSWGRLRITGSMTQILIDSLEMSSRFIEIASAFGVKSSDDERHTYGYRACSWSSRCQQSKHEFCYTIEYMDKHGRDLKDPWSMRQLGIYHQISNDLTSSHYVLIDLAKHAESFMKELIESRPELSRVSLHLKLLSCLGSNWKEYIEYLETELRVHNNKASYSSVDHQPNSAPDISFSDLQELHMLERKIQRAEAAVESCLDIIRGLGEHFSLHSWPIGLSSDGTEPSELSDIYCADMERHLSSLRRLKIRLNSTLDLLSRVLQCQNGELLHASNQASNKMLGNLVNITDQSRLQQETLATILSSVEADSALLKALSIVATVCLPASLIATVFSSSLIQARDTSIEESSTKLVVSTQFWIYVVIALPLMVATLTWTLYLDRRSRKPRLRISSIKSPV